MKQYNLSRTFYNGLKLLVFSLSVCSCANTKWHIQEEYLGTWRTEKTKITVRTEPKFMKFEFQSDSAVFELQIHPDQTASGSLGQAKFERVPIKYNGGLIPVSVKGIIYIIECGSVGKLYPNDPLDKKELELWILPMKDGNIEAELRFRQGGSKFPMAGLVFKRREE